MVSYESKVVTGGGGGGGEMFFRPTKCANIFVYSYSYNEMSLLVYS